ncbi:ATP-binding protein [Syntrophorhabdus aromaticivorans]|uniref:ATP-binding protein n=1 Tax=Syntrophorhabdus aromaticivorans TaxID=328301 RepID=A0A351U044_9BACT|nr:ATP-binding protein [Syntrophorhabdus aromaticivorans]NLW35471.1 ATP-binding protein [Syntrophorhabdus aromaticivorans]HBA53325.1 ATP-binding protein [Syntrophorhabdus aromaticivorans]
MRESRDIPDEIVRPAQAGAVPALLEFVCSHAWEAGFNDKRIQDIRLALDEAIGNIIRFACCDETAEIRISCSVNDSGALSINVVDTGMPFNMLVATSFPEAQDFAEPGQSLSTRLMKKAIKNIEYRRDADRNILILVAARDIGSRQ